MKMTISKTHKVNPHRFLISIYLICLASISLLHAQEIWQPTNGPYGGSIYAITNTPNGMVYAGAGYGGLFRSSDKGLNWQSAGLIGSVYSVFALSDSMIFAGTNSNYFYRTTDAGTSWELKNNGLPTYAVKSMAYDDSKNYLYAATSNGIYRTDDLGEKWASMNDNLTDLSVNVVFVTEGGVVFSGSQNGLFRSMDYGVTWTQVTQGLPVTSVMALAADDQGNLFAGSGLSYGVYMSSDGGNSWSNVGLSGKALRSFDVSPDGVWYAGTWQGGLFFSSDMGTTWNAGDLGFAPLNIQTIHVDRQTNEVYAGALWFYGGGVYFSANAGKNWVARNQGLTAVRVWQVASNPASGSLFAGGYYNGLFRSQDQGNRWEPVGEGMPQLQSSFIRCIAVHPSGAVFSGSGGGGLHRSLDDGITWERVYGEPGYYVFVGAVAVRQDGVVFVGENDADGGISRSGDEGGIWEDITNNLPASAITCIAFDSELHIYVGTGGKGLYQSTDDGQTWSAVGTDLSGFEINDMAIDSQDRVLVTVTGQGVYYTDDDINWIRSGESVLGSTNRPIAVNQADYIFTGLQNLWVSRDSGTTWSVFDRGLDSYEINDLAFDMDNYMWAATYNGVFKTINSTTALSIGFGVKMRWEDGFDPSSQGQGVVVRGPFNNWGSDGDWELVAENDPDLTYSGSFLIENPQDLLRNDTLEYVYAIKAGEEEWLPAPRIALWNGAEDLQLEPVWFSNQKEFSRITTSGLTGESTDSRGIAWADIDNDLDDDLIITENGTSARNDVYFNNGQGLFSKLTSGSVASDVADSRAASWGDFNNDGRIDLFIATMGSANLLYKNEGSGNFSVVSDEAINNATSNSVGAVWADFNNNSWLDLFVANSGGENNLLFMNNGDGSFTKISDGIIVTDGGDSRGCAAADYNNDGYPDLFVANAASGGEANFLYLNNRSGGFTKVTTGPVAGDTDESSGGSWGDFNNDGWLDLYVTNQGNQPNRLYQNDKTGHFSAVNASEVPDLNTTASMGSAWADFDNDGWLDLYVTTRDEQENMFFRNNGDGSFVRKLFGPLSQDLYRNSRGAAWADYDDDGDLDLVVANDGSANSLYRNNLPASNWLKIRLEGTVSNSAALGATVLIKTKLTKEDGSLLVQRRTVEGQSGFLGQNSQTLHFGLRQETTVDSIIIYWPSGIVNRADTKLVNQTLTFTEFNPGTTPPKVNLTAPLDQSTDISLPPGLAWDVAEGATRYHLQLATDISFSAILFDSDTLTRTVFSVSGAAHNQLYYWRVQAGNNSEWGPWSDVWKFTTVSSSGTLPAAPDLIAPANGATNISVPPAFTWNAVSGAQKYWLQVSESVNFLIISEQDSNTSDTSYTIKSESYNTVYYWRVCASNEAGWGDWSATRSFTTEPLIGQPDPPTLLYPADTAQDQPIPVFLRWESNVSGEFEVQISENSTLGSPIFNEITSDKYIFVRSLSNNMTYYWRVRVSANSQLSNWSEIRTFETYNTNVSVSRVISFPTYDRRDEFKSYDYQMVGLPGDADIDLREVFGSSAGENWMAYWDNGKTGAPSDYLVPFDGSTIFKFTTGKAFWLVHNGSININRTIPNAGLNDMSQAEISIHSGWNLITCPFNHAINWNVIKTVNDITVINPIFTYNPVLHSYETSNSLEPLRGYYFYNGDPSRTKLMIPYFDSFNKKAADHSLTWEVALELSTAQMSDATAKIGIAPEAAQGLDRFEYRKPRSFADLPSVYFERPAWDADYSNFANDIRPGINEIESWVFKVFVPENEQAKFSLVGLEQIPETFKVVLIDRTHQQYQDLRENGIYMFDPRPQTSDFEILIGTEEAVNEKIGSILPVAFDLGQNYPNPFNPVTTIPISLPEASEITLKIYNLLGQEIISLFKGHLNAGRHYMIWDGVNQAGNRMPSGVYLYQMSTDSGLRFTGKMIMIK